MRARVAGVTANPVLPHTGPPGTDPLAESIPRNESASIFDPPRITSASVSDPSPRIRSHTEPTGGSGDAELSDSKVCLYTLYILCRHVSIILLCMKHYLLLHLDCPGAASMQEHALCHSLQKRESVIYSCY